MTHQASTAALAAERITQDLLAMGAVHHALSQARLQGMQGQLVLHVLSYADPLALAIIDRLQEEGAVAPEVVSADKAEQQAQAMPGCLLMVLEAPASEALVAELLPAACRADVISSTRMARQLGRIMLVVVAAGRVVGVLAEPSRGMSMGAAERERQRRADRRRRAGR